MRISRESFGNPNVWLGLSALSLAVAVGAGIEAQLTAQTRVNAQLQLRNNYAIVIARQNCTYAVSVTYTKPDGTPGLHQADCRGLGWIKLQLPDGSIEGPYYLVAPLTAGSLSPDPSKWEDAAVVVPGQAIGTQIR